MYFNYIMDLIYILLVIFIISTSVYIILKKKSKETFNDSGRYCNKCDNLSFQNCLRCFNCGYADFVDGTNKCMSGDVNGPYSKKINELSKYLKYGLSTNENSFYDIYNTNIDNVFPSKNKDYYLWENNIKNLKSGKLINRWYHNDPFSYMLQRQDIYDYKNNIYKYKYNNIKYK